MSLPHGMALAAIVAVFLSTRWAQWLPPPPFLTPDLRGRPAGGPAIAFIPSAPLLRCSASPTLPRESPCRIPNPNARTCAPAHCQRRKVPEPDRAAGGGPTTGRALPVNTLASSQPGASPLYLANDGGSILCPPSTGCGLTKGGLPAGNTLHPVTCSSCGYTATTPMTTQPLRHRRRARRAAGAPHSMLDIICTPAGWPSMRLATASGMGGGYYDHPRLLARAPARPQDPGARPTASRWMPSPGAVGRAAPQIITPSRSWLA